MKVFISYPHQLRGFAADLTGYLTSEGYDIFSDLQLKVGEDWSKVLSDELSKADAVIFICSENESSHVSDEATFAVRRFLASSDRRPMILPVVIGSFSSLPAQLFHFQAVRIDSVKQFDKAAAALLFALRSYEAQKERQSETDKESKERLEKGLSKHIDVIMDRLRSSELRQKRLALVLYVLSALVLVVNIVLATIFLRKISSLDSAIDIKAIAILGFVYLFVSIIVISFSKFLFVLAKSFMVESIRCSDRIHAISFGKFYLEAFEENVTRDELIKIFSNWNIDNGASSFRSQSSEEFDPKLNDLFSLFKNR